MEYLGLVQGPDPALAQGLGLAQGLVQGLVQGLAQGLVQDLVQEPEWMEYQDPVRVPGHEDPVNKQIIQKLVYMS